MANKHTKPYKYFSITIILALIGMLFFTKANDLLINSVKYNSWEVTGGSRANIKYSQLTQIDTSNVKDLKVAWIYHSEQGDSLRFAPMQCNPIIINGVLYGVSPMLKLFAIDASSGKEIWKFDPSDSISNPKWHRKSVNMNRGVAYWADGEDRRIIYSVGPIVFSLNASNGSLIDSFGEQGGIDLRKGLGRDDSSMFVAPTSPIMIYRNLFYVGGLVSENTPGHIRAFDILSGKQKWIFHTIPQPGEYGFDTWQDSTAHERMGSTNSWSGFSLDEKRGILFAGTGSPTNDFYGGERWGEGLFGNCILALDAMTGKRIWHFQTVHHDVWDMDISSSPILITLKKGGKNIDAIAQTTKTGLVFVLERETGKPLFPIEERPVSSHNAVPGENLSPTQPFPVKPKPFARQILTENDLNTLVPDSSYQDILKRFRSYRSAGIYTPPTKEGTIVFPGYDGGGEWGGPAFDPETGVLYVNANEMAWVLNLVELEKKVIDKKSNVNAGAILYNKHCMSCHGPERMGAGDYPSLIGVEEKYSQKQFNELLTTGRRMMPGFNHLSRQEKDAIATFILNIKSLKDQPYKGDPSTLQSQGSLTYDRPQYSFTGYNKFLTKEGYPAISPPWGTLNAINLNTGEFEWKIPLGEFEELKQKGVPATGRENYGGPVVTAGGLIFIAATDDSKFRAIRKRDGKILYEVDLPTPGVATPAVYEIDGKQFVVIACGGSKWGGKRGDSYVAFSLPGL